MSKQAQRNSQENATAVGMVALTQLSNLKIKNISLRFESKELLTMALDSLKTSKESKKMLQEKELRDFAANPKSVSLSIRPDSTKTIGMLVAEQTMTGVKQAEMADSLGIRFELNDKIISVDSLAPKQPKMIETGY